MEDCSRMPDDALLGSLKTLARHERRNLARILSRLAEVDRRRLALKLGFHSLFDYCLRVLRYSEPEAARRIHAARAAASYPLLYPMLASGRLSLTAVSMLAPHLTPGNHRDLIRRALGRGKRALEALLAPLAPRPEPHDCIRYIARAPGATPTTARGGAAGPPGPLFEGLQSPVSGSVGPPESAQAPPAGQPLQTAGRDAPDDCAGAGGRVYFSFTAHEALLRDIDRAKELLRHKHPRARLEDVLSDALHALLDRIDPERRLRRKAARRRGLPTLPGLAPRPASAGSGRAIPQWVQDSVWQRDGGRCAFTAPDARRCQARSRLEFDHVRPWALGGRSQDPAGIRLLCREHNALEARRILGDAVVDAAIGRSRRAPPHAGLRPRSRAESPAAIA